MKLPSSPIARSALLGAAVGAIYIPIQAAQSGQAATGAEALVGLALGGALGGALIFAGVIFAIKRLL